MANKFKVGDHVIVTGLHARDRENGLRIGDRGVVIGMYDGSNDRYLVEFPGFTPNTAAHVAMGGGYIMREEQLELAPEAAPETGPNPLHAALDRFIAAQRAEAKAKRLHKATEAELVEARRVYGDAMRQAIDEE